MRKNLNQGIIYTNEKCIGCNRCISECPVLGANISNIENGNNRIYVDDEKCIHCGKCLDVCRHGAREYRDDTERFFMDLKNGKKISLIISQVLVNNYPNEYKNIIGFLQGRGAGKAYKDAVGSDIATWAYIRYLSDTGKRGGISGPCSAVINYILKYKKNLANMLIPVHSPAMCSAIHAKKYLNDNSECFAYIGSCIAKKNEIEIFDNEGLIEYNITIEKILKYIDTPYKLAEVDIDDTKEGLGAIGVVAGGLAENLEYFFEDTGLIRSLDDTCHSYPYLDQYEARLKEGKEMPFLVDIINCKNGCLFGAGVSCDAASYEDAMFNAHKKKNNVTIPYDDGESPYSKIISKNERKMRLFEHFKELNLEDFLCDYKVDSSVEIQEKEYDEDSIFNSMYKFTEEDRHIDCHSCGYDSCREMVKAIGLGYNHKKNCVRYVKDENLRLYMADTLSGIPNTNAFMKKCSDIIAKGNGAEYFAIYFNVKNMKLINRKYGSKTGDIVLADYSRCVAKLAEADEIVARWGGDNFVALFKKTRMSEVIDSLENIRIDVDRPDGTDSIHIGYRAAIYELTGNEKIAGQVMGQVTTTYATIKKSREHIIYFDEELGKRILHNTMIEDMLEPALKNQEFVVYYQPKVSMETNELVGAEALVRWIHDGNVIPPIEFIPICENNGFVQEIDFYVLERVCKDMREWFNRGIEPVKISFNFSKQHFTEKNVAKRIEELATKYDIPRGYLEVEFTETAYIEEFDNLTSTIEELREYDISSSIDDFGTGYSSLSLLQNLRFHTLKLDKSFLDRHAGNERNKTVVASIIKMAKELEMDIVAEGIETSEEFVYLKNLSCDVAQGYLFDRPLPKAEFEKRLVSRHYSDELIKLSN